MSFKVVSLKDLRKTGRENPDKALGSAFDEHPLINLVSKVTLHVMREDLTEEAALTAGLNYYDELGWTLLSMTTVEAVFRKD